MCWFWRLRVCWFWRLRVPLALAPVALVLVLAPVALVEDLAVYSILRPDQNRKCQDQSRSPEGRSHLHLPCWGK